MEQWDKKHQEAMEALDNKLNHGIEPPKELQEKVAELESILAVYSKSWVGSSWNNIHRYMLAAKIFAISIAIIGLSAASYFIVKNNKTDNIDPPIVQQINTDSSNAKLDTTLSAARIIDSSNNSLPLVVQDFSYSMNTKNSIKPKFSFKHNNLQSIDTKLDKQISNEIVEFTNLADEENKINELIKLKNLELQNYELPIAQNAQKFTINTSRDTVLYCTDGLIVNIPKQSFEDSLNNQINGFVDVSITEFNSAYTMFLNRINTNCDQGLLESAGSCYIAAKQKNKNLKMRNDKNLELIFPKHTDNNYQTFYQASEQNKFSWQQEPNQINSSDNINNVSDYYSGGIKAKKSFWQFIKGLFYRNKSSFQLAVHPVPGQSWDLDYDLYTNKYRMIQTYFKPFITINKRLAHRMQVKGIDSAIVEYKINKTGVVTDYFVQPMKKKSFSRRLKRNVKQYGKSRLLSGKQAGDGQTIYLVLRPLAKNTIIPGLSDSLAEEKKEIVKSITSNQLGFINCDRFYSNTTKRYTLKTPIAYGINYIFLPKFNALIQFYSDRYVGQLPPLISKHYLGLVETKDGLKMYVKYNVSSNETISNLDEQNYDKKTIEEFFKK